MGSGGLVHNLSPNIFNNLQLGSWEGENFLSLVFSFFKIYSICTSFKKTQGYQ